MSAVLVSKRCRGKLLVQNLTHRNLFFSASKLEESISDHLCLSNSLTHSLSHLNSNNSSLDDRLRKRGRVTQNAFRTQADVAFSFNASWNFLRVVYVGLSPLGKIFGMSSVFVLKRATMLSMLVVDNMFAYVLVTRLWRCCWDLVSVASLRNNYLKLLIAFYL